MGHGRSRSLVGCGLDQFSPVFPEPAPQHRRDGNPDVRALDPKQTTAFRPLQRRDRSRLARRAACPCGPSRPGSEKPALGPILVQSSEISLILPLATALGDRL